MEFILGIIGYIIEDILWMYIFKPIIKFVFKTIYYTGSLILKLVTFNKQPFKEFTEASNDSVKPWISGGFFWLILPFLIYYLILNT